MGRHWRGLKEGRILGTVRAAPDTIKNAPRPFFAGAFFSFVLTFTLACGGCGGAEDGDSNTPAARGERIYRVNCTICHNTNPAADGSVGPAVEGSSRELIEARVLRAGYPAGYAPKRTTKAMPAQPQLAPHIDDLTAFLNAH